MDFLMVPAIMAIVFATIYGLFELFVRRKERLLIIEKFADRMDLAEMQKKASAQLLGFSFNALKAGSLLIGIGLGLLVGFFLANVTAVEWEDKGILYGASVMLFGGLGLIVAFIIEIKLAKKKD